MTGAVRAALALVALLALGAGGAPAQDASRDRADFDAAAGRAMAAAEPAPPAGAEPAAATPEGRARGDPGAKPPRQAVRVVLPSPYGR